MAISKATLLVASLLYSVAYAQQCMMDPCFSASKLPETCCLLNSPAIVNLVNSGNVTLASSGAALAEYISTVCSSECREGLLGEYRACLSSAPIDQTLVDTYMPTSLCAMQCLVAANIDFANFASCDELAKVDRTCRTDVSAVEGPLGAQLTRLFDACPTSGSDATPVRSTLTEEPAVTAFQGPPQTTTTIANGTNTTTVSQTAPGSSSTSTVSVPVTPTAPAQAPAKAVSAPAPTTAQASAPVSTPAKNASATATQIVTSAPAPSPPPSPRNNAFTQGASLLVTAAAGVTALTLLL